MAEITPDEQRSAIDRERKVWEDTIFRVAKQAGLNTRGCSAGQVLIVMSDKIIDLHAQITRMLEEGFDSK